MASPSKRNKVVGTWSLTRRTPIRDYDGEPVAEIITEQADLLDTHCNTLYEGGSFRVSVKKCTLDGKPRAKTFVGETAWSDADRTHYDFVLKVERLAPSRFFQH